MHSNYQIKTCTRTFESLFNLNVCDSALLVLLSQFPVNLLSSSAGSLKFWNYRKTSGFLLKKKSNKQKTQTNKTNKTKENNNNNKKIPLQTHWVYLNFEPLWKGTILQMRALYSYLSKVCAVQFPCHTFLWLHLLQFTKKTLNPMYLTLLAYVSKEYVI